MPMKTGRQVIGMYRYRQLITRRYCSPTSVVISLRIDLPTSSPIPSWSPSIVIVRWLTPRCVFASSTVSTVFTGELGEDAWSEARSNLVHHQSPCSTLGFSLRFNSLGLFYSSAKRVHLVPVFIACTSVLRSIRPYLAHVQPVTHLHLHLKVTVLVGPMRDGLHANISIATPLASWRSFLLAGEMMILMSRVAVHWQGRVGRLATGRLVSRGERRRRVMLSGYAILKPQVVLRSFRGVVGVTWWQMWRRLRCTT